MDSSEKIRANNEINRKKNLLTKNEDIIKTIKEKSEWWENSSVPSKAYWVTLALFNAIYLMGSLVFGLSFGKTLIGFFPTEIAGFLVAPLIEEFLEELKAYKLFNNEKAISEIEKENKEYLGIINYLEQRLNPEILEDNIEEKEDYINNLFDHNDLENEIMNPTYGRTNTKPKTLTMKPINRK